MGLANLLNILLPIAVIQFAGWAVPGPNHLTIATASISSGRSAGFRAAMGVAAGGLTWTLVTVSGIAVVFELVPTLFVALRLCGAGYLIYLGINAFRAVRTGGMFSLETSSNSPATNAPFRTGYLVMMTNPKAVLFFGSVFAAFIPPGSSAALLVIIVVQFGLIGILLNGFAAFLFSSAGFIKKFQAAGIWISALFGALFSFLGALVVWDVIRGFF